LTVRHAPDRSAVVAAAPDEFEIVADCTVDSHRLKLTHARRLLTAHATTSGAMDRSRPTTAVVRSHRVNPEIRANERRKSTRDGDPR